MEGSLTPHDQLTVDFLDPIYDWLALANCCSFNQVWEEVHRSIQQGAGEEGAYSGPEWS